MSEEGEGEEGLSRHFETAETTETMLLEKKQFLSEEFFFHSNFVMQPSRKIIVWVPFCIKVKFLPALHAYLSNPQSPIRRLFNLHRAPSWFRDSRDETCPSFLSHFPGPGRAAAAQCALQMQVSAELLSLSKSICEFSKAVCRGKKEGRKEGRTLAHKYLTRRPPAKSVTGNEGCNILQMGS